MRASLTRHTVKLYGIRVALFAESCSSGLITSLSTPTRAHEFGLIIYDDFDELIYRILRKLLVALCRY